jgi:hypothetical protein
MPLNASAPLRGDAAEGRGLGDVGAGDLGSAVEVGDGARGAQNAAVAARGQVHALGRAQQQLASPGIGCGDLVEQLAVGLSSPPSGGGRRAPLDFLDLNVARGLVDVEQNPIRTDPAPVSHGIVLEHRHVTRERILRHFSEGAIEPAASIRRKPS